DGRKLVCTPDHQVLCADGRWVRADQLELGRDRVVVGLDAPLDEAGADEAGYFLRAGGLTFTLDEPPARQRALAFARLVGHLISDGSISVAGQGRMNVGQAVDREVVLDDIELISGRRPAGNRYDERKWSIVLPSDLTAAIRALSGVRVGRRIDQAAALPDFVLADDCPVAIVREFLGGRFAAARDGSPRIEVRLQLPDGLSFVERVGFRYCVDKALRASAAAVYWRAVNNIREQRLWMATRVEQQHRAQGELSFSEARRMAAT